MKFKILRCGVLGFIIAFAMLADAAWAADKDINVVFIPKARDQEFWTFMRDGAERAIREDGHVALTWRGPAYNDQVDAQIRIVQLYTKRSVDAIILAPTDRARLMEPARQAAALGIKVIVVDSALDGSDFTCFIGTDNYAAGALAAERMASLLGGQGEVVVLRTVAGSASTDQRANGFIDYLKKNAPKVKVVADEFAGGTRGKAFHVAADVLRRYPQANGIFAVNESVSDGMLRALRQVGLAGKKKFVGFDATAFLLGGLERQEIHGLVVQDPRRMGYLSLKAALAAVKNLPCESRSVFVDVVMVTQENYRKPDIATLLTP